MPVSKTPPHTKTYVRCGTSQCKWGIPVSSLSASQLSRMRRRFREHCIKRHGLNPGDTERLYWFDLERLTLTLLDADAAFSRYAIRMARVGAVKLRSLPQRTATFVEPMECLAVGKLPEGPEWVWEIKLDGYRAIAVKNSSVTLFSRRKKSNSLASDSVAPKTRRKTALGSTASEAKEAAL
jgi:hypothetical protein